MRTPLLTAASLLTLGAASLHAQTAQRPNVLFILADDLGYGDLSCYGGNAPTPNIDRLAAQGTRFSNAHAVASTSTPSRYGMLTGCYPFRRRGTDVAAGNAGMIIRPEQYTVADVFRSAGYRTAAIGKWHLGLGSRTARQDWNGLLDQTPADLGFDYHYLMAATADRVPCVFIEQGRVAQWDASAPIEVSYDWGHPFPGEPLGSTHPELLTKQKASHGHDMAIVNGIGRIGYMRGGGRALWRDEDIPDSLLRHAIGWLGQAAHKDTGGSQAERQPFFMFFATNDVHVPRQPHERFRGLSPMGLRGEAILQLDYTVGRLCAALDSLGLRDNTLIILTSDNGPVLDDGYADLAEELVGTHKPGGPFRGGKYSAYEAGNAVPFIVSGAGAKQGKVSDALVSLIDLPASMAELTGTDIPQGQAADSRASLPTWLGRSRKPADFHVSMAANRSLEIRTQRWKYIEPSEGGIDWGPHIESGYASQPQLYDLHRSLWEQDNVADRRPKVLRQMQQMLKEVRGEAASQ